MCFLFQKRRSEVAEVSVSELESSHLGDLSPKRFSKRTLPTSLLRLKTTFPVKETESPRDLLGPKLY